MKRKSIGVIVFVGVFLTVLVALAMAAQDRYALKLSKNRDRAVRSRHAPFLGQAGARLVSQPPTPTELSFGR